MTLFFYLELLQLNQAKIAALRGRDFIQLEKKLNSKSYFNSSIDKTEIPNFIKTLRYNTREIETFYKPPFYGLRKIIEHPERIHNFDNKENIEPLVTEKLIQFIKLNFSSRIEQYTALCLKGNSIGSLKSLLSYKQVLSDSVINKIKTYLNNQLTTLESHFNGNLNIPLEVQEIFKNRHFYGCLSQINTLEIENSIIRFQRIIQDKLKNKNYSSSTLTLIDSLNDFETDNVKIQENNIILNNNKKEILDAESIDKRTKLQSKSTNSRTTTRNYSKNYSSKGSWKIVITIIMMLITIVRFCSRNNKSSTTNTNNYYKKQRELVQSPDYEIKKLQTKLIYIHTTKEITNTQKEEFNYSRMKFISKYDKFPFPGAHTIVKNETKKKVIFFFNNDFGGFKYKLIEPNSEVTITYRYQYFLIFRGDDPYYTVYTDEIGESKVGVLFNEFEENDLELLKKIYTNDIQKKRKQSEIIISENGVEINEKS